MVKHTHTQIHNLCQYHKKYIALILLNNFGNCYVDLLICIIIINYYFISIVVINVILKKLSFNKLTQTFTVLWYRATAAKSTWKSLTRCGEILWTRSSYRKCCVGDFEESAWRHIGSIAEKIKSSLKAKICSNSCQSLWSPNLICSFTPLSCSFLRGS